MHRSHFQAGEAIVIEDPIAAHLSPYKMAKNCSHCFRVNGETVVPSPILIKAKFCSLQCLDKGEWIHEQLITKLEQKV